MLKFIELNDNKQPVTTFDTTYTSLDKLENAGLLLNNKVVVVDFDNDNVEEKKIIKYFEQHYPTLIIKTTRGSHFYYTKPDDIVIKNGADKITFGGFQVDYKTGTKSYAIVKHKGKLRKANSELRLKDLPVLPLEMYPLSKAKNITGLSDGDGRNSALFYHLRLIKEQRNTSSIVDIAHFINDVIFSEKLANKELDTLIESVSTLDINRNGHYNGDPKNMIEFAEWLVKKLDIKWYKGNLYFYDEEQNKYLDDNILLLRNTTKYLKLKRVQDNELLHQIPKFCERIKEDSKLPIRLKNGIIEDGEFMNITDNVFTVFNLDVTYNPDVYDEYVDKFLNEVTCNRKELRNILEEILGHILITSNLPAYVFFLKGNGKNGKSTFLEMINNFVKEVGNNINLEDFNDATSVYSLIGKLVNCSDETDQIYIEKCKGYKSLASGNTISVRPIYSRPVKVRNTATLLLNANKMPNFKDKTGGFFRRLVIIPFDYDLEKENRIVPNLIEKLSTDNAKSYILNLALQGLKRIKNNNNSISPSGLIEKEKQEYREDTDSVIAFLEEFKDIDDNYTFNVYAQYQNFCEDSGNNAVGLKEFSSRLKDLGYIIKPKGFKSPNGSWSTKRAYYKK